MRGGQGPATPSIQLPVRPSLGAPKRLLLRCSRVSADSLGGGGLRLPSASRLLLPAFHEALDLGIVRVRVDNVLRFGTVAVGERYPDGLLGLHPFTAQVTHEDRLLGHLGSLLCRGTLSRLATASEARQ